MTFRINSTHHLLFWACLTGLPATGNCAIDTVPANIHSVNYSGDEFLFWLEDPLDKKNRGDGETVGPYAASGIMCCYSLPRQWHSGIQVKIHVTHYFKKAPDAELLEATDEKIVEVPPYVDGKVGEIWVLRAADGAMSIVSSDYQPNHPKWPGTVKGWPVPSVEYRRKRADLYIKLAEGDVRLYQELLKELHDNPDVRAESEWKSDSQYFKESIQNFSGPDDERFRKSLLIKYEKELSKSKNDLLKLKENRP